jgi:hypothetical protein
VLQHLGVVVGGELGLVGAAVGHGQPADEVGQPGVRGLFAVGVLVQVVVDLPGFVADHQVVVLLVEQVVDDHVVGQQDLVHPPPGLEAVQVVLGGLALDVGGLVGQVAAGGVDLFALGLQDPGDRVLDQPVDLQAGVQGAELAGDGQVAAGVAQADRGGDVQRLGRPAQRPGPAAVVGLGP